MRLNALIVAGLVGFCGCKSKGGEEEAKAPAAPARPAPAPPPAAASAGCAQLPEVRMYVFAWNAQAGLALATGGKQATAGSLMCKEGVNLKLIREDNTDTMQSLMVAFAEELKGGAPNPAKGAHFIAVMGDGSAAILKGLNDKLGKLGPEYTAAVIGSSGFSRGEDKFMGPAAWKQNPKAARGGLVAGVLRDGDWNIAMKWLGDNGIANNPDETHWDPEALNWINATDYVEASQKYVSGYCAELTNTKTSKKEKHCVDAVVTWTPGDVTVAEQKGGLVSIASTREYRTQMPQVIIGNRKWMAANKPLVLGLLRATFAGAAQIKQTPEALARAAAASAVIYGEKDAAYWSKYFHPLSEKDKTGGTVELGGSAVNDLADDVELFGLAPGGKDLFAATYTIFGNMVKSQYPDLLPEFAPAAEIEDTSYLRELAAKPAAPATPAR
jgi:hypothetical protein